MPSIINLYLNPPEHLFSFDECPGIQALRNVAPALPVDNERIKYSEPNYSRMGTTDLYAFLNINSGKVFAESTENHQTPTLIKVFRKHVASLPETAVIHYICDNLSNHSCPEFCSVVAELCNINYPENLLKPETDDFKRHRGTKWQRHKVFLKYLTLPVR